MSTQVCADPDGMFRVLISGKALEGEPGRPLRFESRREAEDLMERRRTLFSMPVRPLRAHP